MSSTTSNPIGELNESIQGMSLSGSTLPCTPFVPVGPWDKRFLDSEMRPRNARNLEAASLPFGLQASEVVRPQQRCIDKKKSSGHGAVSTQFRADPNKIPKKKKGVGKYHGVRRGHKIGIYYTREEATEQTKGYYGPMLQAFEMPQEVEEYVNHHPSECTGGFATCAQACAGEASLEGLRDAEMANSTCDGCGDTIPETERRMCESCFADPKAYFEMIAQKYTLDGDQIFALKYIASGENAFVTGSAGTGKSKLIQAAVEYFRGLGLEVEVTAPTSLPSSNIGGRTLDSVLHSFLGWTEDIKSLPLEQLIRIIEASASTSIIPLPDVLISDEVSMLDSNELIRLSTVFSAAAKATGSKKADQPFGGAQVVLSGDFHQLSPPHPLEHCLWCGSRMSPVGISGILTCPSHGMYYARDRFAFYSPIWKACKFTSQKLTGEHRQKDRRFLRVLEQLRQEGKLDYDSMAYLWQREAKPDDPQLSRATTLYLNAKEADGHNRDAFKQLSGPALEYLAVDNFSWQSDKHPALARFDMRKGGQGIGSTLIALQHHEFEQQLELKMGSLVILLTNLDEGGPHAGSLGKIIGWEKMDPEKLPEAQEVSNGRTGTLGLVLRGPHRHYQQAVIEQFCLNQPEHARFWPVVAFASGAQRTIFATCAVRELGSDRPRSILSRTQVPLVPGHAMSLNRSQGLTLDQVVLDLMNFTNEGKAYVALSRVGSFEGLYLRSMPTRVSISDEVQDFYCGLIDSVPDEDEDEDEDSRQMDERREDQQEAGREGPYQSDVEMADSQGSVLAGSKRTNMQMS